MYLLVIQLGGGGANLKEETVIFTIAYFSLQS